MRKPVSLILSHAGVFTGMAVTALVFSPARATTFTFSDEYFLSKGALYSSVFPGATGTAPASAFYQETTTGASPVITRLTTGVSSSVPGEFVENTSQNASQALALYGWGLSHVQQSSYVYNIQNPLLGTNLYFQYHTGITPSGPESFPTTGTTTLFTFNGFDLAGGISTADLTFTVEGFAGGSLVDTAILHVIGNTFQTFTENWTNVDTIEIVSTTANPVNWNFNALEMSNIEINDPVNLCPCRVAIEVAPSPPA